MYYSIKELKEGIISKLIKLGINQRFLENPSFTICLNEITKLIDEMNIPEIDDYEKCLVTEKDGNIQFEFTNMFGKKYIFNLSIDSRNIIRCIKTEYEIPFVSINGNVIKRNNIKEIVIKTDDRGCITLCTNVALISNIDCKEGESNISNYTIREYYTPEGIMKEKEEKIFERIKVEKDINDMDADLSLCIPRESYCNSQVSNSYIIYKLLTRDRIDTAMLYYENRKLDTYNNVIVPLSQKNGLIKMELSYPIFDLLNREIIIEPLSRSEIEEMINSESNLKIRNKKQLRL